MKHKTCVSVDKFSDNEVSKIFELKCRKITQQKMLSLFLKAIPCVYCTIYNCCLPCDFVLKRFTFSLPFSEHVSYLCVSEEKTNQLLKTSGN